MITIKGKDEAALVARIEKELKGEDVDIFQSDEVEYTIEEMLALLGYNAKQSRVYIGRLERNTRRQFEEARELNELMMPIALYFAAMVEDIYPTDEFSVRLQRILSRKRNQQQRARRAEVLGYDEVELGPKEALQAQRETAKRLRGEGKAPEKE